MGKGQSDSVFVFDEPTIGLHPLDVQTMLTVFKSLIDSGVTVIVIEHDLDVIRNADYIIDTGPGGVCPFGTKEGVQIYVDRSLEKHEIVYPAAGDENYIIRTPVAEIDRIVSVADHIDVTQE